MDIEESLFEKQISDLLEKEKTSRQANDHITSSEILKKIVTPTPL